MAVTFQHPTPYFDDSYAVNSANNGPYGDALLTELVPYLETHFRMIRAPWARTLTGGSTGGGGAPARQAYQPPLFCGTSGLYSHPLCFRSSCVPSIYGDTNTYLPPLSHWISDDIPTG